MGLVLTTFNLRVKFIRIYTAGTASHTRTDRSSTVVLCSYDVTSMYDYLKNECPRHIYMEIGSRQSIKIQDLSLRACALLWWNPLESSMVESTGI